MTGIVLDLFAAGGGWDVAAEQLGIRPYGVEWDWAACLTGKAAGHVRIQADVAALPTKPMRGKVKGVIGSPPCTLLSAAGHGVARLVIEHLQRGVADLLAGRDTRVDLREAIYPVMRAEQQARNDKRAEAKRWPILRVDEAARYDAFVAALIVEPARYINDLNPEWVALEQVPAAMPVWETYAVCLRELGWSVWTGVLNSANYGVPQTRERAILIASRVRKVTAPPPTHAKDPEPEDLFGEAGRQKWISMAQALGWGATARPVPTTGRCRSADPCPGCRCRPPPPPA